MNYERFKPDEHDFSGHKCRAKPIAKTLPDACDFYVQCLSKCTVGGECGGVCVWGGGTSAAGLEPTTPSSGDWCSIQLSYADCGKPSYPKCRFLGFSLWNLYCLNPIHTTCSCYSRVYGSSEQVVLYPECAAKPRRFVGYGQSTLFCRLNRISKRIKIRINAPKSLLLNVSEDYYRDTSIRRYRGILPTRHDSDACLELRQRIEF